MYTLAGTLLEWKLTLDREIVVWLREITETVCCADSFWQQVDYIIVRKFMQSR
jgi:hypothetical protein